MPDPNAPPPEETQDGTTDTDNTTDPTGQEAATDSQEAVDMGLRGKIGLWIHVTGTAIGHLHEIQGLGFDYIAVKIADGSSGANAYHPADREQICQDAATIGLPVVAWAYVVPGNIDGQIEVIKANLPEGCQDLILDAEVEWENVSGSIAELLCHGLAEATDHQVRLHLSSFVNPSMHPLPYRAFLAHCSSFMPQVYQEGATPLATVLRRMTQEAAPMSTASLDHLLIPTVNVASLVHLVHCQQVAHGLNVWLWDGVQLAEGVVRPAGDDEGVRNYEAQWKAALDTIKG